MLFRSDVGIQQPAAALETDGLREGGLTGAVWACDYGEGGHAGLGGVRRNFADNLVVLAGGSARQPADLESSAVRALHHVKTTGVDIEDSEAGSERFVKRIASRAPHRVVKRCAAEIVDDGHA